jgi:hypothetical protein
MFYCSSYDAVSISESSVGGGIEKGGGRDVIDVLPGICLEGLTKATKTISGELVFRHMPTCHARARATNLGHCHVLAMYIIC